MEERKVAVITGVSSGLGLAMARKFRQEGFLVAGISRHAPAEKAEVMDDFIPTDLTVAGERENAVNLIRERYSRCDVLINNAGIGSYARWEELSEGDLRKLMEIDFFAPVAFTTLMQELLSASGGTVINISSVAAYVPVACMGAYNAGKAALKMYSDTLRMELCGKNIHVLTVCPGRIDTGFSSRAVGDRRPPETPGRTSSSPETLAKRVYGAYRRRKREIVYPAWYRMAIWFVRAFPWINDMGNRKVWKLDE